MTGKRSLPGFPDGRLIEAVIVGGADPLSTAAAALRESEARLELATRAAQLGIWDWDLVANRFVYSPRAKAIYGFAPDEEVTLAKLRAAAHPDDLPVTAKMRQRALDPAVREQVPYEYRIRRPDGSERWILAHGEVLFGDIDGEARALRYVGTLQDVTDRHELEAARRVDQQRMALALEAAGAGAWDWDLASNRLTWSPAIYRLIGIDPNLPADELFGAWRAAVHPDDRAETEALIERATEAAGTVTADFRVVHPDGETRWIRAHSISIPGPGGKVVKVAGINLDVTDVHRDRESLRARAEATERERARLYELSNDLFGVAGFDGYLKVVNPAWERVLGYDAEALQAVPFIERIHPEDRARTAETVGLLRHGRDVRHFETRVQAADDRLVWISWSAVAEGDLFYAVGRDVTREKEREEALRQAQKMEAIGQLTGGIAHDFNNLLQAVQGNFDLISRRAEDERLKRWAEQGREAAERGAKLTSQLLAFSRAQKMELRPIAVAELLDRMEEMLARALGPLVRLRFDFGEGMDAVLGDATQLEMAVLNLAINARDAMPEGGDLVIRTGAVASSGDSELEPGAYLRIDVADTGTGMEPHVAARAFDPFFTTKGPGKGTGLGLSQVYGMARQAGGTARIASLPGEGTIVSLLLRSTEHRARAGAVDEASGTASPAPNATVMVVDDDRDVRRFLTDTLHDLGYAVLEADGGAPALALLETTRPDIVVVDFAMPGMNGAELADAVRARHPDLPVVFASGHADTAAIEAAAGADAPVLRKPFRIRQLQVTLAAILADRD